MKKLKTNVVIIGAGPAGLALALYLKRAKIDFLLLEKAAPGGKLNNIATIDNYLGIKSITGPNLAFNMYQQITALGVEILNEEALKIEDGFLVHTSDSVIATKIVVLALGITMKKIAIPGYDKYFGHGISTCAICDGYLYRNKKIIVIGNNEIADKEYNYLKSLTSEIKRIDGVKEKILSFTGDKNLQFVTTTKQKYITDAAFVYSKESINYSLIDSLKITYENNRISVDKNYETSVHNCYAIGDVINKKIYQVIGAVNDASIASVDIIKKIR